VYWIKLTFRGSGWALGVLTVLIMLFTSHLLAQTPKNSLLLHTDDPADHLFVGQTLVVNIVSHIETPAYGFGFQVQFDPKLIKVFSRKDVDGTSSSFVIGKLFGQNPQRVKNTEEALPNSTLSQIDTVYTLLPPASSVNGEGIIGSIAFTVIAEGQTEIQLLHPRLIEVVGGNARDIPLDLQTSLLKLTIPAASSGPAPTPPINNSLIIIFIITLVGMVLLIIAILLLRRERYL
jgi:hypothetical protein